MTEVGTSLGEVQAFMGAALLRTREIAEDAAEAARTEQIVSVGIRLSAVEQLEIYREQFWLRHIDAMREDFITIHYLALGVMLNAYDVPVGRPVSQL